MTDDTAGITVAGRVFRPVTSRPDGKVNFDQYNYLMSHVWAASPTGETMQEIVAQVADTGHARAILAGLVQEEVDGELEPWTAERATRIAKFFGQPHDMVDCVKMQLALIEVLPSFFPGAGVSSNSSAGASDPATPMTSEATRTPTDSASSVPSSEYSPATT